MARELARILARTLARSCVSHRPFCALVQVSQTPNPTLLLLRMIRFVRAAFRSATAAAVARPGELFPRRAEQPEARVHPPTGSHRGYERACIRMPRARSFCFFTLLRSSTLAHPLWVRLDACICMWMHALLRLGAEVLMHCLVSARHLTAHWPAPVQDEYFRWRDHLGLEVRAHALRITVCILCFARTRITRARARPSKLFF